MIPNVSWVWSNPIRACAFGFGSGLSRIAPGTAGTLYAWAIYLVLQIFLATDVLIALVVLGGLLGIFICGKVGQELESPDHGGIVWDEFIAFWLILLVLMPAGFGMQALAFALFRFFDAIKPGPIGVIDAYFKQRPMQVERLDQAEGTHGIPTWVISGFGVMIDDLAAALATLMVIAILVRIF